MGSTGIRSARAATSRGTALPTALLVLVVLTLLGTAAVFTSSTELDIAGNGRRELRALSVAEAGVHEAFARLNVKDPANVNRIVPGVNPPGSNTPEPSWSMQIVAGTPGAGQVRTLTASADPATELPISTTIQYKKEQTGEVPVEHCNGTCDVNEVVRFHTDYDYAGTNVPTGAKIGPPVLRLVSTYGDGASTLKTLTVEAVRSVTQAKTPGTIKACSSVTCTGSNTVDATSAPGTTAIVASGPVNCGGHLTPPTATVQENQPACPADLFDQTFGVSKEDMRGIADIVAPGPYATPPNGTKGKIIYVTGASPVESSWQSNPVIGTEQEPVILVFEGDFRIQGTVTIYGIIYVMGNFTIGAGTPRIFGAVVAEGTTTMNLTGNSSFSYDPNVLDNLNKLSPFTTILWKVN